jgi:glutathione S-transferase
VRRGPLVTLFDAPDCWKCVEVKEALDALGVAYEPVTVRGDPAARATLVAAQGEPPQVPMLVDDGLAVWDRRRILAYLAETYGPGLAEGDVSYRDMPPIRGGTCRIDGDGC